MKGNRRSQRKLAMTSFCIDANGVQAGKDENCRLMHDVQKLKITFGYSFCNESFTA